MFEFLKDVGNYDLRKVGKTDVKGLTVSTAFTSDMGYETAIIDAYEVYPVQRYPNKEAAILGHIYWLGEAETLTEITCLGFMIIKDKIVTVTRRDE